MDKRVPIVDEHSDGYLMCFGENGQKKIRFIELISKGGSCLVYRAEVIENDHSVQCVIKEYYPDERNITIPGVSYEREYVGAPINIVSEYGIVEDCKSELENQRENVERELYTNYKLFYDGTANNNPYMYRAQQKFEISNTDTSYIVLDTSEGRTLRRVLENSGVAQSGMEWKTAFVYARRLLEIIRYFSLKGYVHGDISLDNIWVAGANDNEYLLLLDFGSAFCRDEYSIIDMQNDIEIRRIADLIVRNTAIGSSNWETGCLLLLRELQEAKEQYMFGYLTEDAYKLVETVKQIDIRADLYSIIKIFFYMIVGKNYDSCNGVDEISNILGKDSDDVLVIQLNNLMKNNSELKYDTLEKVKAELDEIEIIYNHGCSPLSLIKGIQEELRENIFLCEEQLFAPIEEKSKPSIIKVL